jgi:hypothetical protein
VTEYYALPHPDAGDVTYWRRGGDDLVRPWPRPGRALATAEVTNAIDADRTTAQARFAALTDRCSWCGRKLTDPASKARGVGPVCAADLGEEMVTALTRAVATAHTTPAGDEA